MIVYLPSERVRFTDAFQGEVSVFPETARDKLWDYFHLYLKGERLSSRVFKTFKIDGGHKILEFKVKDNQGNWRAIGITKYGHLILIYAFHKKSQELLERDKETIRKRIRSLP